MGSECDLLCFWGHFLAFRLRKGFMYVEPIKILSAGLCCSQTPLQSQDDFYKQPNYNENKSLILSLVILI